MKFALAGNPNSGKTSLFNRLTGKTEYVGNWAGVTVETKEAKVKAEFIRRGEDAFIIDLPGAYSISPFTSEESIAKEFVTNENPDVIINVVDSTNLSRSLFFTTQLIELGIPVVVALNKSDLTLKKQNKIDIHKLSKMLDCPVVLTVSVKNTGGGLHELVRAATKAARGGVVSSLSHKEITDDSARYEFVKEIVAKVEKRKVSSSRQTVQDKVDRIVAHKWLGILIFAAVIWLVFSISQAWIGPWFAGIFASLIDSFYAFIEGLLGSGVNPVLSNLLLDGIIGGVGAVVGFLPLIMVLFFCLALLEDCGYMARVAVVMDRFFKKIGLSGKSVIPMVIGTGCAIPGVMSTRTIKDERQRRTTIMITPFMPCGAKLPIIALFAGLFFKENGWVGTAMYFLAILIIFVSGLIIKQITGDTSKQNFFVMELPEYKWPSIKRATRSMLSRGKSYIIKAGTIILICNVIIQLLQTFNWQLEPVVQGGAQTSILSSLASPVAVLFIPLGFGMWQFAAAAITGFIAKENVVGTLAVSFAITNFIDLENMALIGGAGEVSQIFGIGAVAALAYLVFNLFTPPCIAAMAVMGSEMESKKWLFGAILFQLAMGYTVAFAVYQLGTLATTGAVGTGFIGGLIAVFVIVGTIVYLMKKPKPKEERA